ncbi:M20/M25/M40 family metallo-hydrolase [Paraflavisolibacter sp. H34]|uniref:M20/M25/M40 family metallo-hydrolase n=1 Tax=Huijunlia imazamoxiresistens TaxID=3127457 RepID=UPI00301A4BE5
MRNLIFSIVLLVVFSTGATAQKLRKEDKQTVTNLQKHIEYLAADALEGRRTGSKGEQQAREYISNEFAKAGLQPKGSDNFYQPFDIYEGRQINPSTLLTVGGQGLYLNREFFPLAFSANTSLEALPSMALQEVQMPWFYDLKELLEAQAANPHFDLAGALQQKAADCQKKGATALFVYNTSKEEDGLKFDGRQQVQAVGIPVVYLTRDAVKKYFNDPQATLDIKLKTDIGDKKRSGTNVLGFLDNKAPATIILGAHYDHLGRGEEGTSLQRDNSNQVHNGADDNASGVAALIELARQLKASGLNKNNYLFIAFSGEEQGLMGSKYFTEHPTVDLGSVNYMINLDMVGRLNEASPTLTVGGFGTSPAWAKAYGISGKKGLYSSGLSFRFDSSGTGPSDHTSFYLKNIPVLFYFTGIHADYHKPTDDFTKINYPGEVAVIRHIYSLLEWQHKTGERLVFTRTKAGPAMASASFSVTLGIMPDYSFSGHGVRVDAVSADRPAQKAGLQQGDVIIQLGDFSVQTLEKYMQALGHFKKGDRTTVQFSRGEQKLSAPVEF